MRRKLLNLRLGAIFLVASLALWSEALAELSLDYTVALSRLRSKRFHVTLTIRGLETDEVIIHGVPAYMDNPLAEPRRRAVRRLVARDEAGNDLRISSEKGSYGQRTYRVSPAAGTVIVEYDLNVDFKDSRQTKSYAVKIPFMDRRRAWLYGNYLFCYPILDPDAPSAMRSPADIHLDFELPDDVPLHGLPKGSIHLSNLHELLSLQFGLGCYWTEQIEMAGGRVQLIYESENAFDVGEREALRERTARIVSRLIEFFGGTPFPEQNFYYFRKDGIGGLEGAYTCQAYVRPGVDVSNLDDRNARAFMVVALHEYFHTWNPIGMFALDDPWFKEGVTSYYGNVLSINLAHLKLDDYVAEWASYPDVLKSDSLMSQIQLTDSRIWHKEYDGEDWRMLTYARGHAVALLLDVLIRDRTENRYSLDDVMRALCRDYLHGAFTHNELLKSITSATGVDAGPFFEEYVSGIRAPTFEEVERAFGSAKRFGVFDVFEEPARQD
jgi:predicted metalloprotease with PDZ domain